MIACFTADSSNKIYKNLSGLEICRQLIDNWGFRDLIVTDNLGDDGYYSSTSHPGNNVVFITGAGASITYGGMTIEKLHLAVINSMSSQEYKNVFQCLPGKMHPEEQIGCIIIALMTRITVLDIPHDNLIKHLGFPENVLNIFRYHEGYSALLSATNDSLINSVHALTLKYGSDDGCDLLCKTYIEYKRLFLDKCRLVVSADSIVTALMRIAKGATFVTPNVDLTLQFACKLAEVGPIYDGFMPDGNDVVCSNESLQVLEQMILSEIRATYCFNIHMTIGVEWLTDCIKSQLPGNRRRQKYRVRRLQGARSDYALPLCHFKNLGYNAIVDKLCHLSRLKISRSKLLIIVGCSLTDKVFDDLLVDNIPATAKILIVEPEPSLAFRQRVRRLCPYNEIFYYMLRDNARLPGNISLLDYCIEDMILLCEADYYLSQFIKSGESLPLLIDGNVRSVWQHNVLSKIQCLKNWSVKSVYGGHRLNPLLSEIQKEHKESICRYKKIKEHSY